MEVEPEWEIVKLWPYRVRTDDGTVDWHAEYALVLPDRIPAAVAGRGEGEGGG